MKGAMTTSLYTRLKLSRLCCAEREGAATHLYDGVAFF